MGFNDDWQLDVNTATAVELLIMTTFLQNTKRRHRLYMHRCITLITLVDDEVEERLHAAALENQVHPYLPHASALLSTPKHGPAHCCIVTVQSSINQSISKQDQSISVVGDAMQECLHAAGPEAPGTSAHITTLPCYGYLPPATWPAASIRLLC